MSVYYQVIVWCFLLAIWLSVLHVYYYFGLELMLNCWMVITDTAASHCQYTVICSIIITNHWYLFIYLFIYYIYYLFIL